MAIRQTYDDHDVVSATDQGRLSRSREPPLVVFLNILRTPQAIPAVQALVAGAVADGDAAALVAEGGVAHHAGELGVERRSCDVSALGFDLQAGHAGAVLCAICAVVAVRAIHPRSGLRRYGFGVRAIVFRRIV